MMLRLLDEVSTYELEEAGADPTGYAVLGAAEFVLGWVAGLIVDLMAGEVRYLVVAPHRGLRPACRAEERLVPLAWVELVAARRQVRLPHLSRRAFAQLPAWNPGEPVPEHVAFPLPGRDDPEEPHIA